MEHHKALTSDLTTTDSNNNNNSHHHHHYHHNRRKKRTTKQQQLVSLSLSKKSHVKWVPVGDSITNQERIFAGERQQIPMRNPMSWTKKWTKWFSSCGSERRTTPTESNAIVASIEKRSRTKSENDMSKRGSTNQEEKKILPTTTSTFTLNPISIESQEGNFSKTSSHHHHHHHQSIDKVNNSNSVIYRDTSRRNSNPFFSSARYGEGGGERTSIAVIPLTTNTSQRTHQNQEPKHLSRSADRLTSRTSRRELRYEEHNDYIPPAPPLNSIQCQPTIDHYARTLNQSSYFYSTHRRSQIEVYQLSSTNNRLILPRPYSSNIPFTHSNTSITIPVKYSSTIDNIQTMSSADNNAYGKLSECHSPLTPVENSSVKAPRRIESTYSQFPILTTSLQEPVYVNSQSLYDNILYPESSSTSKIFERKEKKISDNEEEKKSCASQTQLTWTMATFSSFVDLENQSIIIPQPDPTTLYSIVKHHQTELPPSASSATIEHMKRTSPKLQFIDDIHSPSNYQRPQTPSKVLMIEKRDGSFQTLLTIAPTEDIDSNKQLLPHDSTPSPLSTGSSSTTDHHRHRKHKSRSNTSRNNISTRDVGLQVNIQTVKKIIFSSDKSDDSSLTTTMSSHTTVVTSRELKDVETNTEPLATKHDSGTSCETSIQLVTSSSQTLDSPTNPDRQTKAAQTPTKSLRDQSIETNNRGLFVCDLSSLLKNGVEETVSIKRKS